LNRCSWLYCRHLSNKNTIFTCERSILLIYVLFYSICRNFHVPLFPKRKSVWHCVERNSKPSQENNQVE
jgi:hypothetical protein